MRKKYKENISNFHLPNISKKPIHVKFALPRPTTNKKHALFLSVRVGAYCIRPHSSIKK